MISSKEDAIKFCNKANEKNDFSKDELQASIEVLQKVAAKDGLSEEDFKPIVEFMTKHKASSSVCSNIISCLIPTTTISKEVVSELLLWFFMKNANEELPNALSKKFLQWLNGITYYELTDVSVIQSFYYSFIFLLNRPHLESNICRLLCLLSKPEDARRWVVQQILQISANGNPKPHANALLSLLKSFRASVVPESIPPTNFMYKPATPFDELLKIAHNRKTGDDGYVTNTSNSNIQWTGTSFTNGRNKKSNSLIPLAESIHSEISSKPSKNKLRSIYEFKTLKSVGIRPFVVDCPTETLSLLANVAGYHVLAFSDFVIKTRFFHKLYNTLCRVFLLNLSSYSDKEKKFFLTAIKELQEYTRENISVVSTFLYSYIPIWDGDECREEIFSLLEWIEIRDNDDLINLIFPSLRQIFISSGTHCKCLIIETMAKLMRNLLIMDKKEHSCFSSQFLNSDTTKSIEAIHGFVRGLISNGLIWNHEKNTRSVLNSALNFYETAQAVEQAGDLPLIMIMPPVLVYNCLFSGSRVCIARLCSVLLRFQTSVERLFLLGVYEDFATEVQKLNIYILDYYSFLWNNFNLQESKDSFMLQHGIFNEKVWKLKEIYGGVIERVFGIDYNSSFWDPKARGIREVVMCQLAEDFPSVLRLKQVAEGRSLQAW